MEAAQLRGDQEGLAQGVRARPFRISMCLASLAGGHPGLSRFDLLAMGQQCVMRQTVRRVTEKVSFLQSRHCSMKPEWLQRGSLRRPHRAVIGQQEPVTNGRRASEISLIPAARRWVRRMPCEAAFACMRPSTDTVPRIACMSALHRVHLRGSRARIRLPRKIALPSLSLAKHPVARKSVRCLRGVPPVHVRFLFRARPVPQPVISTAR